MNPDAQKENSLVKCADCRFAGNSNLPGFSRCIYFPNWINNSNSFKRMCDKYEIKSVSLGLATIYGGVKITVIPKTMKGSSNLLKNQFNPFKPI